MAQVDKGPLCIMCKKPAFENCYSKMGILEVYKTGLCEKCFDEVTKDPDENDEEEETNGYC